MDYYAPRLAPRFKRSLTVWVLCCLLGIQAVGLLHRLHHGVGANSAVPHVHAVQHSTAYNFLASLSSAACLDPNYCAALDQLLLGLALPAAAILLALLATRHTRAARLVLARARPRRCSAYPRGPPR
jgi:hypothetical protein